MEKIINEVVGGRYFVCDMLGKGGFSYVYRVKDMQTGQEFAMKNYFSSNPGNKKNLLEGLERELNVLKNTSHPNLPKIYDLIKENDSFFLIMEIVNGENLKSIVDRKGPLKKKEIKHVMKQVCSGLYYLHSLEPPIVYRDLKPSNIVMDENGQVKLVDFGIAKRYSKEIELSEKAFGSKGFAAPEQFGNKKGFSIYNTDIRTDIYGIGTTLYYLKTGKIFVEGVWSVRLGHRLKKVIKKCTKKCPDERFQSVIEVLVRLETLA
ncbi:MAG: serine/threonine protein kinase [Eubacterium sp.]|nr:serine/threonine protein kinase [Eubacterium sp.]